MSKKIFIFAMAFVLLLSIPVTHAQKPGKVYRIGFLSPSTAQYLKSRVTAFRKGLRDLGWIEGKNILFEERHAGGRSDRRSALAAEMVRRKPDVIVTHGGVFARIANRAAKEAGRTIPIVMALAANPVRTRIVASLARPGGTITGLSDSHADLIVKRLELLKEVAPSATRIAVIRRSKSVTHQAQWELLQAGAPNINVTLLSMEVSSTGDVDRAIARMRKERPGGLIVFGSASISKYLKRIFGFAIKNRMPATYTTESGVALGALMSYGADHHQLYRRAASYVDKILKGAKPADLPIEQPTKFKLVINLKTAKKMGLTIPPELLLRATKVIK